jgi:hypothetical protein
VSNRTNHIWANFMLSNYNLQTFILATFMLSNYNLETCILENFKLTDCLVPVPS